MEESTRDASHAEELRRKNVRVALILGGFALLVFLTSIPYWEAILEAVGSSTR